MSSIRQMSLVIILKHLPVLGCGPDDLRIYNSCSLKSSTLIAGWAPGCQVRDGWAGAGMVLLPSFHFLGLCSMLAPECCSLVSFIEVALMELCVTAK